MYGWIAGVSLAALLCVGALLLVFFALPALYLASHRMSGHDRARLLVLHRPSGRLGNLIIQYSNMRLLAEVGKATPRPWHVLFRIKHFPKLPHSSRSAPRVAPCVRQPDWSLVPKRIRSTQKMTFALMAQYGERVRGWWLPLVPEPEGEPFDWVLHMRFGDIWKRPVHHGWAYTHYLCPMSYYLQALPADLAPGTRVAVVSEQAPASPLMSWVRAELERVFPSYVIDVQRTSVLGDFARVVHTRNRILSMSTFALSAAFLGYREGDVVVSPSGGYVSDHMLAGMPGDAVTLDGLQLFSHETPDPQGFKGLPVRLEPMEPWAKEK